MKIRVRLYGHLVEAIGRPEVTVEAGEATAGAVLQAVRAAHPSVSLKGVRLAVNEEYVRAGSPVKAGDVVSLLPPVGGG